MKVTRRSKVLGGLLLAALLCAEVWFFVRPNKAHANSAPPPFLEQAEYERLLAIPLAFEPVPERLADFGDGKGDHRGGDVPVTPYPNGPAFRPGVKVKMTEAEFFQFYQAYESPKHPVFVTSDSLIQAYFTTLREELARLEAVEGWNLNEAVVNGLAKIGVNEIAGPPQTIASARRLARINLAIVARLFDAHSAPLANAEEDRIVQEEVQRIEAAAGPSLPGWLYERPDPDFLAIDYRHFRPVGNSRSEYAKRRFRAIRWLQVVPWRIDRDDHLLAALIAARATNHDGGAPLRDQVATLLMLPDDIDAVDVSQWYGDGPLNEDGLKKLRDVAAQRFNANPPRLNDVRRFKPRGSDPPTLRWRSAGRASDLVALSAVYGEHVPNGLALTAVLGSSFARARAESAGWDKAPAPTEGDGLAAEWWRTAATLFALPPKGSPEFMNHAEWHIKSCQTALAGWVLWRHATEVFGKHWTGYENGGPPTLRGVVEPNAEFFRRMGRLADFTSAELRRRGLLQQSPRRCAAMIPEQVAAIERLAASEAKLRESNDGSVNGRDRRREYQQLSRAAHPPLLYLYIKSRSAGDKGSTMPAALVQFWHAANQNRWPADPGAVSALKMLDVPTEDRLKKIAALANRSAQIVERQLKGEAITKEDDDWFLNYGRVLAGIAGYGADADNEPVDDAAAISEVVFDPPTDRFHVAAVGRPRALWVLYPYQGQEVLCRGAVYPYYEFDSKEKPSDEAWQKQVRDGKQPPQPEWIKPLLREGTPEKTKEE